MPEVLEELTEHRLVSNRVRKDVGMVPIDVGQHCKLRREMQELGPGIEDGRRVFVAFEDEFSTGAPGGRGAKVFDGHPKAKPRIAAG